ncbi:hypothetical protein [Ammoniphilus resinae]|nr:hypothetical protein [Ammoniphilus resinae]
MSKPEKEIYHLLLQNNIDFEMQKRFDDLKHEDYLRFDFCIYLDKKMYLIEYDGQNHFKPVFSEESFQITQLRDQLKNEYCLKNNIPLLRIPYYKNHVKALINYFNKQGYQLNDVGEAELIF